MLAAALTVLAACTTSDITPDAFSFDAVDGAELSTLYTSNTIEVAGIDSVTSASVTGGGAPVLVINGTDATGDTLVALGDEVQVRLTSSDQFDTTVTATVTIGGVSADFEVTTRSAAPDTTPDAFAFTAATGVELSTPITSDVVTVAGVDVPVTASVSGGGAPVLVVNGADQAGDVEVDAGDEVQVRLTSSDQFDTTVTATVTIGGVSADFDVTTKTEPIAPDIQAFDADLASVFRGGEIQLSWTVTGDVSTLELTSDRDPTPIDVTGLTGITVDVPANKPTVTYSLRAVNDETLAEDTADTAAIEIELWVCTDAGDEVTIADAGLEDALRATPAIPDAGPITCADMQSLITFNTDHYDGNEGTIASLEGLQHAVNLEQFVAQWNVIDDLAPIANLTALTFLNLDKNAFTDLEPLRDLTALEHISLWDVGPTRDSSDDGISDLEPLSGLPAVTELYLSENAISDLTPIAGMSELQSVYFIANEIDDLSALAGKSQLNTIRLGFNQVSDLSPLVGLDALAWVQLPYNLLEDVSALLDLPNLWAVDLEGNYLTDVGPLADNTDFPAAVGTGRDQEPLAPTASIGYNCLDTTPGSDADDDVATLLGRGVTVIGFDAADQRVTCVVGAGAAIRELRLQQFRESMHR